MSFLRNEKTFSKLDAEIEELESQKRALEKRKTEIIENNSKLEKERLKHRQARIQLEEEVNRKTNLLIAKKDTLAKNIKLVKQELAHSYTNDEIPQGNHHNKETEDFCTDTADNSEKSKKDEQAGLFEFMQQQIRLDLLQEQIKQKEQDLECPVCLDTSQSPIYMCQEQHIICKQCWLKVHFLP